MGLYMIKWSKEWVFLIGGYPDLGIMYLFCFICTVLYRFGSIFTSTETSLPWYFILLLVYLHVESDSGIVRSSYISFGKVSYLLLCFSAILIASFFSHLINSFPTNVKPA